MRQVDCFFAIKVGQRYFLKWAWFRHVPIERMSRIRKTPRWPPGQRLETQVEYSDVTSPSWPPKLRINTLSFTYHYTTIVLSILFNNLELSPCGLSNIPVTATNKNYHSIYAGGNTYSALRQRSHSTHTSRSLWTKHTEGHTGHPKTNIRALRISQSLRPSWTWQIRRHGTYAIFTKAIMDTTDVNHTHCEHHRFNEHHSHRGKSQTRTAGHDLKNMKE